MIFEIQRKKVLIQEDMFTPKFIIVGVSGEKEQTFSRILNLEDLNMEDNDNINKR